MVKWIVTLICATTLTACGSMSHMRSDSSSGYSGSSGMSGSSDANNANSSSGYGGQNYAWGSSDVIRPTPGALGAGTLGEAGP